VLWCLESPGGRERERSNGTPLLCTRYQRACSGELASRFLAERNTIPYARLVFGEEDGSSLLGQASHRWNGEKLGPSRFVRL
jgi:hypothetical protein